MCGECFIGDSRDFTDLIRACGEREWTEPEKQAGFPLESCMPRTTESERTDNLELRVLAWMARWRN